MYFSNGRYCVQAELYGEAVNVLLEWQIVSGRNVWRRLEVHILISQMADAVHRPEPRQEQLNIQEDELEAAAWMPLEEFDANTSMRSRPLCSKVLHCVWGGPCQAKIHGKM